MSNYVVDGRLGLAVLLPFIALTLSACGSDSPSEPQNAAPVANAGANQLASLGAVTTLDATASSDPDGDALTYSWSLNRPVGSSAVLSSPTDAMPTFTPDVAGTYTADLTVSDGTASNSSSVVVTGVQTHCDALVDLFPTPVSNNTSPFANTDDAFISVGFDAGFDFTFYGQTYSSIYLNSNGGMTFEAGVPAFDVEAQFLDLPTIAPFWGDMGAQEEPARPAQMYYEACPDRFILYHQWIQDFDEPSWDNTGTVTLLSDGTITFEYGDVDSQDIMVGIFDGSHTADNYVAVQSDYFGYAASSGIVLFDAFGSGPSHAGQLSGQTITFHPTGPANAAAAQPAMSEGELDGDRTKVKSRSKVKN